MERVKFFSIRDKYFAYDISSTNCVEIDAVALSILPEILSGRSRNLEYKYQHIYHPGSLRKCIKECRELIENKILGTQPEPYTPDSESNVTSVCLHHYIMTHQLPVISERARAGITISAS
jgi:hypothetical protein